MKNRPVYRILASSRSLWLQAFVLVGAAAVGACSSDEVAPGGSTSAAQTQSSASVASQVPPGQPSLVGTSWRLVRIVRRAPTGLEKKAAPAAAESEAKS